MSEHNDAVRNYRWIQAVICWWFHRKHHETTSGAFYHGFEERCGKCGRVWFEEDF